MEHRDDPAYLDFEPGTPRNRPGLHRPAAAEVGPDLRRPRRHPAGAVAGAGVDAAVGRWKAHLLLTTARRRIPSKNSGTSRSIAAPPEIPSQLAFTAPTSP